MLKRDFDAIVAQKERRFKKRLDEQQAYYQGLMQKMQENHNTIMGRVKTEYQTGQRTLLDSHDQEKTRSAMTSFKEQRQKENQTTKEHEQKIYELTRHYENELNQQNQRWQETLRNETVKRDRLIARRDALILELNHKAEQLTLASKASSGK